MTVIGPGTTRYFEKPARAALRGGVPSRCYIADSGITPTGPQIVFILLCGCGWVSIYEEIVAGDINSVDAAARSAQLAQSLIDNATEKLTALAAWPGGADVANKTILCTYCRGKTTIVAGFPFAPPAPGTKAGLPLTHDPL